MKMSWWIAVKENCSLSIEIVMEVMWELYQKLIIYCDIIISLIDWLVRNMAQCQES